MVVVKIVVEVVSCPALREDVEEEGREACTVEMVLGRLARVGGKCNKHVYSYRASSSLLNHFHTP